MARWKKVPAEEKERLAGRLRAGLAGRKGVSEKRMFGGICFLLRDHMLCGTGSGDFLFRVGKQAHDDAVKRPGARAMVMNGRRMAGFIWVDPGKCDSRALKSWLRRAEEYVGALPPKSKRR